MDALACRAAMELWEHLAGTTTARFAPAISVAAAPDHATARILEQALGGLAPASLTSTDVLGSRLPIAEILGPAALAYLDPADFRADPGAAATPLDLDHLDLRRFLLAADAGDLDESGIQEITTPAFAIREHGQVVAAAGYRNWPRDTAHRELGSQASIRLAHLPG